MYETTTIRVSKKTRDFIESRGVFGDSHESVLARLIAKLLKLEGPQDGAKSAVKIDEIYSGPKLKSARLQNGLLTPEEELELPILKAIYERGDAVGEARIKDVFEELPKLVALTPEDKTKNKSGAIRWKHRVYCVLYRTLQEEGLVEHVSKGVKRITQM